MTYFAVYFSWLSIVPLQMCFTYIFIYISLQVSTIFWWDNFDRNIETMSGAGSIHNTPGIAFQEVSDGSIRRNEDVSIPKSKRRSIKIIDEPDLPHPKINAKTNPELFTGPAAPVQKGKQNLSDRLLYLWKALRHLSSSGQHYPRFAGWIISRYQSSGEKATVMTYLPPVQKPITDYGAIFEVFYISRKLAKQSNMLYTHITMDIGAAIKAYQVIWNNPEIWSDIIIHPGDFHAMMTFFAGDWYLCER